MINLWSFSDVGVSHGVAVVAGIRYNHTLLDLTSWTQVFKIWINSFCFVGSGLFLMICNGQLIAYFTCQSDQSYASFSIYWWTGSYTLTKPSVKWSCRKCMTWCSSLGETHYYQPRTFSTCSREKRELISIHAQRHEKTDPGSVCVYGLQQSGSKCYV